MKRHFSDFGPWEVLLGVWDKYVVVPKQALSYCPFPQIKYMLVNWYICTEYIPVNTGMYCVYKNISEDAVLCRMTVGNDPVCV